MVINCNKLMYEDNGVMMKFGKTKNSINDTIFVDFDKIVSIILIGKR